MLRCLITATIDGEVYARFVLETDAEFFAKEFSKAMEKPVTIDYNNQECPRTYTDGKASR